MKEGGQDDRRMRRQREQEKRIEERESKRGNGQILLLTYGVVIIFFCILGFFCRFMLTESGKVINNPYNKRQEILAKKVKKGKILSSDGKVLAKTETNKKGEDKRIDPYDKIFCHVVGRSVKSMTGLEREFCYPMLSCHLNPITQLSNTFRGEKSEGDNLVTTLNVKLQRAAYDALGSRKGAVVAIEPSTGKILAMVSKPAYDPNTVDENWETLINASDDDSKLINRASQGLYPPGSTFKMMTAMEFIRENPDTFSDFKYRCKGTDTFSGNVINCYGKEEHGREDLENAFAKSCNGAFAKLGTELDLQKFTKLCEKFYFNKALPVDFEYNKSKFLLEKDADMGEITQTAIGQGKTTITPLLNAIITATLANDGVMMKPYLADHIENADGTVVTSYTGEKQGRLVKKETAGQMKKLMKAVVKSGTGSSLKNFSYQIAGKTGSAEFDSEGTSHAWFVGFAPANEPKIAVSIVVEGAGTGSQYAVPIAREMFRSYLGN